MKMKETFGIQFRDFAIRKCGPDVYGRENDLKFELIKYNEDRKTCFVIAWLEWNPKEPGFELISVGLRLMEYYEPGLDEFILKTCELLEFVQRDKEGEE